MRPEEVGNRKLYKQIKAGYHNEVEKLINKLAVKFNIHNTVAALMLSRLVQSKEYIPKPISTYESMLREGKWKVTDRDELDKWRNKFYKMVALSYKPMGGHPNFKSPNDVNTKNANVYHDIDIDGDGEPDAMKGFKKKSAGLKSVVSATDGQTNSKHELLAHTLELLKKPGNFAEVSGKWATILIAKGAPVVTDYNQISKIMKDKDITPKEDGWYTRKIGGENHTKIIIGKPKI